MIFCPGDFSFAPAPPGAAPPLSPPKPRAKRPWAAFWLLGLILLGCALAARSRRATPDTSTYRTSARRPRRNSGSAPTRWGATSFP